MVEDQQMFADFLRKLCEDHLRLRVVGTAGTGAEGVELCRRFHPDLLLLDFELPDANGLDLVPDFKAASPRTRILAVSVMTDENTMTAVVDSGLDGFIDKAGSSIQELAAAISAVVNGETWFSPVVARVRGKVYCDPHSWIKLLTNREREVLRLIGGGRSNNEAAAELRLSPATIEKHRREIMAKLKLHSVSELIRFAMRHGLAKC